MAQVMTFAEIGEDEHVCTAEVKENACAEKRCGQYVNNSKKCQAKKWEKKRKIC
jgi:hypothetical protein